MRGWIKGVMPCCIAEMLYEISYSTVYTAQLGTAWNAWKGKKNCLEKILVSTGIRTPLLALWLDAVRANSLGIVWRMKIQGSCVPCLTAGLPREAATATGTEARRRSHQGITRPRRRRERRTLSLCPKTPFCSDVLKDAQVFLLNYFFFDFTT